MRDDPSHPRRRGTQGAIAARADSAFYSRASVNACRDHDVRFSVTVHKNKAIRWALAAIPDDAWSPIAYWLDGGADVAETTYTAFAGTKDAVDLPLIVRRVRPTPGSQLVLDVVFDYHASSPTVTVISSRSEPTTALTPSSSSPSATLKSAGSPTSPRECSPPTPHGWVCRCLPTWWRTAPGCWRLRRSGCAERLCLGCGGHRLRDRYPRFRDREKSDVGRVAFSAPV